MGTMYDSTTPEAIPYLWTDAVPFFAAYYALLSAQAGQRQGDADRMFARYQEFTNRARRFSATIFFLSKASVSVREVSWNVTGKV